MNTSFKDPIRSGMGNTQISACDPNQFLKSIPKHITVELALLLKVIKRTSDHSSLPETFQKQEETPKKCDQKGVSKVTRRPQKSPEQVLQKC